MVGEQCREWTNYKNLNFSQCIVKLGQKTECILKDEFVDLDW